MNIVWSIIMLSSLLVMIFYSPSLVLSSMIEASTNVVSLSINLIAIYSVWLGILEIVEKTKLSEKLACFLSPIIKKLFKVEKQEHIKYISLNLSANLLGLGNAATPSGIKAIKSMDNDLPKTRFAMLLLLIINATGIQILPTTMIGLRLKYGAKNASNIIFPSILSSTICTVLCVCIFVVCYKLKRKKDE